MDRPDQYRWTSYLDRPIKSNSLSNVHVPMFRSSYNSNKRISIVLDNLTQFRVRIDKKVLIHISFQTSRMDNPRQQSSAAFSQPPISQYPASPVPASAMGMTSPVPASAMGMTSPGLPSAMGMASPYRRDSQGSIASSFPSSASAMAAAAPYRRDSQASLASINPATPAAVAAAAVAAPGGGRASRARPPSSRLNSRPPTAARAPSRPITPSANNEDPRVFAIMQMGKIEEGKSKSFSFVLKP